MRRDVLTMLIGLVIVLALALGCTAFLGALSDPGVSYQMEDD